MADQPELPALSDDEMRETLDLMATAIASMSNRIDDLTRVADKQIKVSTEARIAAFAARDQTDPDQYAEFAVTLIDERLSARMDQIKELVVNITRASNHTQGVLKEAETDRTDAARAVWEREQKADRLKSRLPWFGLGAVVLALAMTVLLPRFIAAFPSGCAILGGVWTTTTTGVEVCVQDRNDAWFR